MTPGATGTGRVITVSDGQFRRGGQPHRIISGAIHYFRVHPALWRDRLQRVAALGVNTVETYAAWNVHERTEGRYDFTGWNDLARFIETADGLGLDVIVRPGPYICAEWDFGGLPGWLMRHPRIGLRCSDPTFLDAVRPWMRQVCAQLRPLLATAGGPVVAVQVENEYGSYGDDLAYRTALRDMFRDNGIDVLLVTSDGPGQDPLASGTVDGAHATVNFGSRPRESFGQLRRLQPGGPDMCMEFWDGWFDHWGEPHHTRTAADAAMVLDDILAAGASVNLYMAHGGTNFGLWSGCNLTSGTLQPTVTSYDYDAPVGEAGELTEKFHAFREVVARYTGVVPLDPPPVPVRQAEQDAPVTEWIGLLDSGAADPARHAAMPLSMEDLGQDHGLVLYRGRALIPPDGRTLCLDGLADRATVLVDGVVAGVIDRNDPEHELTLTCRPDGAPSTIDVVVENQGRISFAEALGERKGLRAVRIGRRYVHHWSCSAIRLDRPGLTERLPFGSEAGAIGPVFGRARLEVPNPADGFLELPGWTRGFVWLNGFLLGRYRSVGPQLRLYAPAPLWRAGRNEIVVLEMERPGDRVLVRAAPRLDGGARSVAGLPSEAEIV